MSRSFSHRTRGKKSKLLISIKDELSLPEESKGCMFIGFINIKGFNCTIEFFMERGALVSTTHDYNPLQSL